MKLHLHSRRSLLAAGLAALALAGCNSSSSGDKGKPVVVTTTTMVTDLVQRLAGGSVEIVPLMGPTVDPHLYKPTSDDVKKLQRADAIIYSGLHLEGRMVDTFHNMAQSGKKTFVIGDALPKEEVMTSENAHAPDPHIWGDASLWAKSIQPAAAFLVELIPAEKEAIEKRSAELQSEFAAAHAWLKQRVESLPKEQRVLVTSHDAFRYFGRAYGLEVIGVQGISTDSEAALNDIARVVDLVKSRKVKAIFVESSVPRATIERISKDSGAKIGGELLSDALGPPGEMEDVGGGETADRGTTIGMLKSNMHRVVTALKP